MLLVIEDEVELEGVVPLAPLAAPAGCFLERDESEGAGEAWERLVAVGRDPLQPRECLAQALETWMQTTTSSMG